MLEKENQVQAAREFELIGDFDFHVITILLSCLKFGDGEIGVCLELVKVWKTLLDFFST